MQYKRLPCESGSLGEFVEYYFEISGRGPESSFLLPPKNQQLIFILSGQAEYCFGSHLLVGENCALLGFISNEWYTLKFTGDFHAFGLSLSPDGLYHFLGTQYTKDRHFLQECTGLPDAEMLNSFCQALRYGYSMEDRVNFVEKYLQSRRNKFRDDDLVRRFLKVTKNGTRLLSSPELASELYTNQRSLELRFLALTGTTPGKYLRLLRFHKVFRDFFFRGYTSKELVYKHQYTDHSHLSRDFVKYIGKSPKKFVLKEDSLLYATLMENEGVDPLIGSSLIGGVSGLDI